MPTSGSPTYSVIGQTPVSGYDTSLNSAMASGTPTTASTSLNVNFSTSKVGVTITTSFGGLHGFQYQRFGRAIQLFQWRPAL